MTNSTHLYSQLFDFLRQYSRARDLLHLKALAFFPKESILFLLLEDLTKQPDLTVRKVCRFIDVDAQIDCTKNILIANQGKQVFEDTIRGKITAPLKSIPLVAATATLLPFFATWTGW